MEFSREPCTSQQKSVILGYQRLCEVRRITTKEDLEYLFLMNLLRSEKVTASRERRHSLIGVELGKSEV